MFKVNVFKQSNYPIKAVKIKKFLKDFFQKEGMVSDSFVSVAFVDEKKMLSIARQYYPKDNNLHSVFSFVEKDVSGFNIPKRLGINLGEIIICYPLAVKEASRENILVEEKILSLLSHSGEHLMGRHHAE